MAEVEKKLVYVKLIDRRNNDLIVAISGPYEIVNLNPDENQIEGIGEITLAI